MIPNIFHLIYFYKENVEFPLTHSITVNSVRMLNNPDKIYFYSDRVPEGKYWEKISPYVELVKVKAPEYVFDRKLYHLAHKSDVLRLQILMEQGGIYIDMDVICKKPFTNLLKHDMVLGKQGRWRRMGLCNGVILANKDSEFLRIWYNEFRNFRNIVACQSCINPVFLVGWGTPVVIIFHKVSFQFSTFTHCIFPESIA